MLAGIPASPMYELRAPVEREHAYFKYEPKDEFICKVGWDRISLDALGKASCPVWFAAKRFCGGCRFWIGSFDVVMKAGGVEWICSAGIQNQTEVFHHEVSKYLYVS